MERTQQTTVQPLHSSMRKKNTVSKLEGIQEKEIKMIKGLAGLTYEERLKELIMYGSDKE